MDCPKANFKKVICLCPHSFLTLCSQQLCAVYPIDQQSPESRVRLMIHFAMMTFYTCSICGSESSTPVDISEISTISSPSKCTARLDALKPPWREKLPASEIQLDSEPSGYSSPCAEWPPPLSKDAVRLCTGNTTFEPQRRQQNVNERSA